MSSIYPKVFVINLKRSLDRKKHMQALLDPLPLEYEFVEAVDASDLTDEYIREIYDDVACRRNIRRSLSKPEIACALSHIKVWEIIKESGLEEAFIMEDDIYIKDEEAFREVLKARNRYPKKWELILFGHGNSRVRREGAPLVSFTRRDIWGSYGMFKFRRVAWGTLGYLIRSKGAQKLLKVIKPLKSTIDDGYTGTPKFVRLYGISPVLIEEEVSFGASSTITARSEQQKVLSGVQESRIYLFFRRYYNWYYNWYIRIQDFMRF